ncbi:hypothetical protein [Actinosynnema sp. NPDC020468]|uniref:hypothetical protein n=1 Tax=Actinosynnema sp. NPDC020468 TaxID=3154488 RepID=UPI0033DE81BC
MTDSAPSRAVKVFGAILAPTTVLTALLFYFGTKHAYWFCQWFGVPYTTLGLSAQDYLIRSADGMFVPLTAVAATGLVLLWAFRLLESRLAPQSWARLRRRLVPVAVVLGVLLVGAGSAGVAHPPLMYRWPGVPGLCVAVGFLLFPLAERLHPGERGRTGAVPVVQWVLTFVLVTVGLFWAVTDYSAAVGQARGYEYEVALPTMPVVVVYSTKDLEVRAPGVTAVRCADPDTAYLFRYNGFVLVLQSAGHYFLLPRGWNRRDGAALLLPRSSDTRLEFYPDGATPPDRC